MADKEKLKRLINAIDKERIRKQKLANEEYYEYKYKLIENYKRKFSKMKSK